MLQQTLLHSQGYYRSQLSAEASVFVPGTTHTKQSEDRYSESGSDLLDMDDLNAPLSAPIDMHTSTANGPSEAPTNQLPAIEIHCDKRRCGFCDPTGCIHDCCRAPTTTQPCTTCTKLDQLFTGNHRKQEEHVKELKQKLEQQDRETLNARYTRLHAEKNRKIEQLEEEIVKVGHEDAELRADTEKQERILKALNIEIRKLEPVQAFVIKEKRGKKGWIH